MLRRRMTMNRSIGSFYAQQLIDLNKVFDHIALKLLIAGLSVVGLCTISLKVFSFIRLLVSLFILPGKTVKSTQYIDQLSTIFN